MLFPVYLRGKTYYLHTRFNGHQVKRSLRTSNRRIAIIRAAEILKDALMPHDDEKQLLNDFANLSRYELDLAKGVMKADGAEDHQRMMEALQMFRSAANRPRPATPEDALEEWGMARDFSITGEVPDTQPTFSAGVTPQHGEPQKRRIVPTLGRIQAKNSLTLSELLDKYFLLKKVTAATVTAHRQTVKEFEAFFKVKCYITDIMVSDLTRYQEYMASEKGNSPRTIDTKVGYIKALLNFAIKQGYLLGKNPAEGKSLLTKKQKLSDGYAFFETDEVKQIYGSEYYKEQKIADPDYYYVLLLELVTGCRVAELTSLTKSQFQKTPDGRDYIVIRQSKTDAGKRNLPIPKTIFDMGLADFLDGKTGNIFKYAPREGKGSGNAVGKKFSRQIQALKLNREKLVFHSLRKFVNDYFMNNGVEYEPRCQFFGHEIENVNVAVYAKKFTINFVADMVTPVQEQLLAMV